MLWRIPPRGAPALPPLQCCQDTSGNGDLIQRIGSKIARMTSFRAIIRATPTRKPVNTTGGILCARRGEFQCIRPLAISARMLPNNLRSSGIPFFQAVRAAKACSRHLPCAARIRHFRIPDAGQGQINRRTVPLFRSWKVNFPRRTIFTRGAGGFTLHWKGHKTLRPFWRRILGQPKPVLRARVSGLAIVHSQTENRYAWNAGIRRVDYPRGGSPNPRRRTLRMFSHAIPNDFYGDIIALSALGDRLAGRCGCSAWRLCGPHATSPSSQQRRFCTKNCGSSAHRGGFILSYNNCPTVRKWFSPSRRWGGQLVQYPPRRTGRNAHPKTAANALSRQRGAKSHAVLVFCPPTRRPRVGWRRYDFRGKRSCKAIAWRNSARSHSAAGASREWAQKRRV